MGFYHPNIRRCEHIKTNGTQCGSPALHRKKLCFFHKRCQDQRLAIADSVASIPAGISIAPALNLPVLEDADSVQVAITQVLQLLLTGQLEHKTAALALYALQTASSNLRHTRFEPYPPTVVINPSTVGETLMGEEIWKNSDFNVEEDEDEEEDDDAEEETDEEEAEEETDEEEAEEETDEEEAEEETDEEESEEEDDDGIDGEPQEVGDENDSQHEQEENAVPALQAHSAPRSLQKMSDSLPPNWREELRAQIAARVQHAALEGTWINELLHSSKPLP